MSAASNDESLRAMLLRACDLIEAGDLADGHTLMLRKDCGRGDLDTSTLRDLILGRKTPEEVVARRSAISAKARSMTDKIFKARAEKPR